MEKKEAKFFATKEKKIMKNGCPICGGDEFVISTETDIQVARVYCMECGGEGTMYGRLEV